MASAVRFVLFAVVVVGLVVLLVVPLVVAPLVSSAIRDAAFPGRDGEVQVDLLGPGLLTGRANEIRFEADDVHVEDARIGHVDVRLGGVSLFDRSFERVDGQLQNVQVSGPGGRPIIVSRVDLSGPADRTAATGYLAEDQAAALVRIAVQETGVPVDRVSLGDGTVRIEEAGVAVDGRLAVSGGALLLETPVGVPIVLLRPSPSDPWQLSDVVVTPGGVAVEGVLDARALAEAADLTGG